MAKKTTRVDVSDDKLLKVLVKEYWLLKNREANISHQLSDVKTRIFHHFSISKKKKMTKKEASSFEKLTLRLGDKAKSVISIFVSSRTSPNWQYIEDKLKPAQMRYAKKESRNVELRITRKD